MTAAPPTPSPMIRLRRWLPVLVLALGLALVIASGAHRLLSFEALVAHQAEIQSWRASAPLATALGFLLLYALVTAFSLPVGLPLTIIGGWLFGALWATGLIAVGASLGAVAVFLAARYAIGDRLRSRAGAHTGSGLDRLIAEIEGNAASYLLMLRLVPLFPFWLVNLAPAFTRIRATTFLWTTALGILPGTFVYAGLGNGVSQILARLGPQAGADDRGGADMALRSLSGAIWQWQVLLPLLGLAALSLLPVVWRRIKRKRGQ